MDALILLLRRLVQLGMQHPDEDLDRLMNRRGQLPSELQARVDARFERLSNDNEAAPSRGSLLEGFDQVRWELSRSWSLIRDIFGRYGVQPVIPVEVDDVVNV